MSDASNEPVASPDGASEPQRVTDELAELREQIAEVDRSLLELLHRRMDLAERVGRVKHEAGYPIVVPEVHGRVLTRARQHADACGVSEQVMESIFDAVMRGSVERQHRLGVALEAGTDERMLIVGGRGNMGMWLEDFLQRLGHPVDIVDTALQGLPAAAGRFGGLDAIEDLDHYRAIWISVPLGHMPAVLDEVVQQRPAAQVIEIASIKDHLRPILDQADELGVGVTSLHPMFGPGKSVYETLNFVLACRHDPIAERKAIDSWLRHPYTQMVPVQFDHHDRLMGWLLGLAHLSGMVFGCALERSGLSIAELEACASTTYRRQVGTASSVLLEDPDLYYDIQSLNPHRSEVYKAARAALDDLIDAVQEDDRENFRAVMTTARRFLGDREA